MSELDDLDELEILLSSNREGSTKRIRAGLAKWKLGLAHAQKRPKWKKQLHMYQQRKNKWTKS